MMSKRHIPQLDEKERHAVKALRGIIRRRYPSAVFEVARGEDPEGVYLRTIVDIEDVDDVLDFVLDALFRYQVEQGLPVYVLPLQPVERVLNESRRETLPPAFGPG